MPRKKVIVTSNRKDAPPRRPVKKPAKKTTTKAKTSTPRKTSSKAESIPPIPQGLFNAIPKVEEPVQVVATKPEDLPPQVELDPPEIDSPPPSSFPFKKFSGISAQTAIELTTCQGSCEYFIRNYCIIDDKQKGTKFKFDLWPMQAQAVQSMVLNRYLIALKARQVGFTWMALCKALWTGLLEKPSSTILLFSLRDDEAKELLSRIKRVYSRLPAWLKCKNVEKNDSHEFKLSNGTEFKAFPTGKGDSYTASMAILDEFDMVEPEMQLKMMQAIGPTIAVGGQIYLISKSNKAAKWSESYFKSAYLGAKTGKNQYTPLFLPWWARPDYTQDFYDQKKREAKTLPGGMDELHSNYPESDTQALAPSTGDKRFLSEWLERICRIREPMTTDELKNEVPQLTHLYGLKVYKGPSFGGKYVGGCDPAQGTPASNPSAIVLTEAKTGEEILSMNEKLTPSMTAQAIADITRAYMGASWLIERNNHGIAVLQSLHDHHPSVRVLPGHDDHPGWLVTGGPQGTGYSKTKVILYDRAADLIRDGHGIIHTHELWSQMAQVELSTLDSPITMGNCHGDMASAFVLALMGGTIDKSGDFDARQFQWGQSTPDFRAFGVQDPTNRQSIFGQHFQQGPGMRQRTHNPFGRA